MTFTHDEFMQSQAQVACLEAALKEALEPPAADGQKWGLHDHKPCPACLGKVAGCADLLAANAAKVTALRAVEITAMRLRSDANVAKDLGYAGGDEAATADELMAFVEPVLSDGGEDWLEVREQAHRAIINLGYEGRDNQWHAKACNGLPCIPQCREGRAALDALEVT